MLVSTTSSLAGGLIIYFQGIESLEDALNSTSQSEVRGLRDGLRAIEDSMIDHTTVDKQFFFSPTQIKGNDTGEWARSMLGLMFTQTNASQTIYMVAIALQPYGPLNVENSSAMYICVWLDVFRNGSKEMVGALGGPFERPTMIDGGVQAHTYQMDLQTGLPGKKLYVWGYRMAGHAADGITYTMDPRNDVIDAENGYTRATVLPDAHAEKFAGPRLWHSPELDHLYGYHNLDGIFEPPPAPHPWHVYKAVRVSVGYLTTAYDKVLSADIDLPPETMVIFVDRGTGRVIASTEPGFDLIAPECKGKGYRGYEATREIHCFRNISWHYKGAVQDAFDQLGAHRPGVFLRKAAGGSEYFMRREWVSREFELLWIRPVSVVEDKVREALNYLIVFVMLVVVFDSLTSIAEVVFIAIPLRHLSSAILHTGNMRTEEAQEAITRYTGTAVMVKEIRNLMRGMRATVGNLEEFRTFIPEQVLASKENEDASYVSEHSGDDDDDDNYKGNDNSGDGQGDAELTEAPTESAESIISCKSAKSHTSQSSRNGLQKLALHLELRRKVAVLAINVMNWSIDVAELDEMIMISNHSLIVSVVHTCAAAFSGTVDIQQGDRFCIGFNTAKKVHLGELTSQPLKCSFDLRRKTHHNLSMASVHGKAKVGNIGNHIIRRFTVVTPLLNWVMMMESFTKRRTGATLIDQTAFDSVSQDFVFRIVDAIMRKNQVIAVAEVVRAIKVTTEEWMYQFESREKEALVFYAENRFALSVIHGLFDEEPPAPPASCPCFLQAYAEHRFTPKDLFGFFLSNDSRRKSLDWKGADDTPYYEQSLAEESVDEGVGEKGVTEPASDVGPRERSTVTPIVCFDQSAGKKNML